MVKSLGKNHPSSKTKSTKKGRLDISAQTIVDNIIFTGSDYWAYYRLANVPYDYVSPSSKNLITNEMNTAFVSIFGERSKPLDCHLIVTSFPLDVESWRRQNDEDVERWKGRDAYYERAMDTFEEILEDNNFSEQVTFLGIKLGNRNSLDIDALSIIEGGFVSAIDTAKKGLNKAIGVKHKIVSQSEEKIARDREKDFAQVISSGPLQGREATAEELLLLIKKQFYPDMPSPYIEIDKQERYGNSDISFMGASDIRNASRWLQISQVIGGEEFVRYRACLSIAKLPEQANVPNMSRPLIHFMQQSPGADFFTRFTIYSKDDIRKILNIAEKEAMDELKNATQAQSNLKAAVSGGVPTEVADGLSSLQGIREFALVNPYPWTVSTMNITVEAESEEALRRKVAEVKQRYQSIDILVTWPVGEQAKLFLEQLPGDFVRVPTYKQTATLSQITTSGFNYSSEVGDKIRPENIGRKRR